MRDFISALPKAELHLHLEGSVELPTLRELSSEVPGDIYSFTDFQGFLRSYGTVCLLLRTPGDYALVTRRLLERLQEQNVRYVEVNLSVGVMLWKNQDAAAMFGAVSQAAAASPVPVRWIFDAVRQFGVEAAERVAELAVASTGRGVVAFGIGGDEVRGPARCFRDVFDFARSRGLKLVPHAGETDGPASIWAALEIGADRIGHGFRAIEDPVLLSHLRDHNIPLEICITSNVRTGAVPSLKDHPVRRLFDAGVPLILSTDDPAMFGATLNGEYRLAAEVFGFSRADLELTARRAFEYGFDSTPPSGP